MGSGQAKNDTVESSIGQKRSRSGQAKKDTPASSTGQKRLGSGQAKNDTVETSIAQRRSRSGQAKKDTTVSSTASGCSKLEPVQTDSVECSKLKPVQNDVVESSTGQKRAESVQAKDVLELPTRQKRSSSGVMKNPSNNSTPYVSKEALRGYLAKHHPSILESITLDKAYDSFIRWLICANQRAPIHKEKEYLEHWTKYKIKDLNYKRPKFDSFEPAPYKTFEAFYRCVSKHFPLIVKRIEPKTAYGQFMSWLEKVKEYSRSQNIKMELRCNPKIYIIHWMELISEDYDYAEGEAEKEGRREGKYKWVRCQDPDCPHRSSDKPEQGHTHFYDPEGNPVTETLMLYDVGLFTFQKIMPAGKDWSDQLPHYPINPTIRRRYAPWTEEDQKALLESKGLWRKYIIDDDEEEGNNAAMPNDYEGEGEVSEQEADNPTLQMATNGENATEAPEANQPATDPSAQTTDPAEAKVWGQKRKAEFVKRIVGDKLSQAEQDQFCRDYYEGEMLPNIPKKRPGKQFVFNKILRNIPDGPYPRKTDYFYYGTTEPEENMDTRAKFNLPLSAKEYAKIYEEYKKAKEQGKPTPYDRNWMQKAGIHEWAAASESTSLCGVSGIKSEDFDQCGVLIPGDILYIKYNVEVGHDELETRTKSKKKAIASLEAMSAEESASKKLYTSQKSYTHEISGRLIAFAKDKQVHLHVNGFLDENDDPLIVRCIGPQVIAETFAMLAPEIKTSRADPFWYMVEVRSQTGEEFGSLYRVRQQYELFKAEMDEWAGNAGVEWRTMVKSSVKKKEDAKAKRAEGVKNGDFDKKGGKKLSKEEKDAKKAEKEAETKKKEEAKAEREAKAKERGEAKAKREANAKEKEAKAQAAKFKGKGNGAKASHLGDDDVMAL